MDVQSCVRQAKHLLEEMERIDFGYPLGANVVLAPQTSRTAKEPLAFVAARIDSALMDFYSYCDGISAPDVHVGYFLKPLAKLLVTRPDSEPSELIGPIAGSVVSFGSTGGGGIFALRLTEKDVLYLPPGPLRHSIYDGTLGQVKRLAPDFSSFLCLLVADIQAFVKNRRHHYLV